MDASPVGSPAGSKIGSKADVSRDEFRELMGEVRELQRRVSALEQGAPKPVSEVAPPPLPELHISSDAVATIGRALLAIAGAYLLRALTELRVLPPKAGVILGIAYAGFWLWHAMRVEGKLAAIVNAVTAVLILGPLVWEAVMRLQAIPTWGAAGVIAVFSIAPLRRRDVAAISTASGASIAIALLVGTHDLVPFTLALLLIAAAADWAVLTARWLTALMADTGVLILVITVARGVPEGYVPISIRDALAIQALLFVVFIGSAVTRTLIRQEPFTFYEIGQTAIAFGLSLGGVLYLTSASAPVGAFALGAGALCYAVALGRARSPRNVQTYAAFGALLALSGMLLLLSGVPLIAALCAFAIGISWTAIGRIQAPAFLWTAMWISGVAAATTGVLFGAAGGFPRAAAGMIIIAAAISFLKISATGQPVAAALIGAASLWSVAGLAALFGAGSVALIVFAIALAGSGARWKKDELIWLMYACMIVAGGKILLHDFSHQSTALLVVSLLVYGAALIALPRILQKR